MKWLKVIAVFAVLTTVSVVSVTLWVKRTAALNEEERQLFKAVSTHPEIVGTVGAVKDAAFAYGRLEGHQGKVDKLWTRKTSGDTVEGNARLNIRAERAWGQVLLSYDYQPRTGQFRVTRVRLEQLEAAPTTEN